MYISCLEKKEKGKKKERQKNSKAQFAVHKVIFMNGGKKIETLHNIAYLVKYKGNTNTAEHSRKSIQVIDVQGSK